MSRRRRLVRALVEGLGQAQSGDGCVTAYTVRYHCTLASVAAYGPGSAAAEQAQRLVAEIIAAYDALGFRTRTTATGETLYDCHGLAAAAQVPQAR